MNIAKQTARHLHETFFGPNLTGSHVEKVLETINLEQAIKKVKGFNTILALTYHIGYYVEGIIPVFEGKDLLIRDKYSFDHPVIETEQEWNYLIANLYKNVNILVSKIELFNNDEINGVFAKEKYGTFFRNIHGLIEHTHYHLGQIVILKKMIES